MNTEETKERLNKNIKLFHAFGVFGERESQLIVTKDNNVYGLGRNESGLLGLGHNKAVNKPELIPELCHKKVNEFIYGAYHCIALSSDGKIYSFGANHLNQLGYQTENNENNRPKLIESLINENITQVSCGYFHSIALTQNGVVYGWGDNSEGQLGIHSELEKVIFPMKIDCVKHMNSEKVVAISCGSNYSMALTDKGNVYSWGCNEWGQLGINSKTGSRFPKLIQEVHKEIEGTKTLFKKICCGSDYNLLLSTNGDIYSFGTNYSNQLGYDTNGEKQLIPRMIEMNPRIEFTDIYCQFHKGFSTAFSATNKKYFVWGLYSNSEVNKWCDEKNYNSCEEAFNSVFITNEKTNELKSKINEYLFNRYINEYTEVRKLGSGGFGEVFEAIDKRNQKRYAIKRINIKGRKMNREKLYFEMNVSRKLLSEYVVEYEKSWIERNQIFIQMELCLKTLEELNQQFKEELNYNQCLCESPVGFCVLLEIMKEVIEGVDYLHRNDIIHRDLKPENILITEFKNGRIVRIADFGISCIFDMRSETTEEIEISRTADVGDLRYIAPELDKISDRESGRLLYDNKVDIYSLGMIFGLFFRIQEYIPSDDLYLKMNSSLTELKKLTERMLIKDKPKDRPNCEEILSEINTIFKKLIDLNEFKENLYEYILIVYLTLNYDSVTNIESLSFLEKKFSYSTATKIVCDKMYETKLSMESYSETQVLHTLFKNKFIVLKDGSLYGLGSNINGILGLGHNQSVINPTIIPELCGKQIIEFCSNNDYCIARSIDGKLYRFGSIDSDIKNCKPILFAHLKNLNITQINCTDIYIFVLTQNGEVICLTTEIWLIINPNVIGIEWTQNICDLFIDGISLIHDVMNRHSNKHKKVDNVVTLDNNDIIQARYDYYITTMNMNTTIRTKVEPLFIKKISCSNKYILLLSTNGEIYTFKDYSLVMSNRKNLKLIETQPRIVFSDIFCHPKDNFSAALSPTDNSFYVWGKYNNECIECPKRIGINCFEELINYERD